jgi:ATP-dependent DNA helicase RecQ
MFQNNLSVAEIAKEREMSIQTIEAHLARSIQIGEISVEDLVPNHKIDSIKSAIIKFNESGALSPIKEFLGNEYSYGEIRAVMAAMQGSSAQR